MNRVARTRSGTPAVAAAVFVIGLAGCGGSASSTAQIRTSFERLANAFHSRDAETVCELLFPFGQHQLPGALAARLKELDTPHGRASYGRYVAWCRPELAKDPRTFALYDRYFSGAELGTVKVRGNVATARVTTRTHASRSLKFVHAASEWRLLIGVQ